MASLGREASSAAAAVLAEQRRELERSQGAMWRTHNERRYAALDTIDRALQPHHLHPHDANAHTGDTSAEGLVTNPSDGATTPCSTKHRSRPNDASLPSGNRRRWPRRRGLSADVRPLTKAPPRAGRPRAATEDSSLLLLPAQLDGALSSGVTSDDVASRIAAAALRSVVEVTAPLPAPAPTAAAAHNMVPEPSLLRPPPPPPGVTTTLSCSLQDSRMHSLRQRQQPASSRPMAHVEQAEAPPQQDPSNSRRQIAQTLTPSPIAVAAVPSPTSASLRGREQHAPAAVMLAPQTLVTKVQPQQDTDARIQRAQAAQSRAIEAAVASAASEVLQEVASMAAAESKAAGKVARAKSSSGASTASTAPSSGYSSDSSTATRLHIQPEHLGWAHGGGRSHESAVAPMQQQQQQQQPQQSQQPQQQQRWPGAPAERLPTLPESDRKHTPRSGGGATSPDLEAYDSAMGEAPHRLGATLVGSTWCPADDGGSHTRNRSDSISVSGSSSNGFCGSDTDDGSVTPDAGSSSDSDTQADATADRRVQPRPQKQQQQRRRRRRFSFGGYGGDSSGDDEHQSGDLVPRSRAVRPHASTATSKKNTAGLTRKHALVPLLNFASLQATTASTTTATEAVATTVEDADNISQQPQQATDTAGVLRSLVHSRVSDFASLEGSDDAHSSGGSGDNVGGVGRTSAEGPHRATRRGPRKSATVVRRYKSLSPAARTQKRVRGRHHARRGLSGEQRESSMSASGSSLPASSDGGDLDSSWEVASPSNAASKVKPPAESRLAARQRRTGQSRLVLPPKESAGGDSTASGDAFVEAPLSLSRRRKWASGAKLRIETRPHPRSPDRDTDFTLPYDGVTSTSVSITPKDASAGHNSSQRTASEKHGGRSRANVRRRKAATTTHAELLSSTSIATVAQTSTPMRSRSVRHLNVVLDSIRARHANDRHRGAQQGVAPSPKTGAPLLPTMQHRMDNFTTLSAQSTSHKRLFTRLRHSSRSRKLPPTGTSATSPGAVGGRGATLGPDGASSTRVAPPAKRRHRHRHRLADHSKRRHHRSRHQRKQGQDHSHSHSHSRSRRHASSSSSRRAQVVQSMPASPMSGALAQPYHGRFTSNTPSPKA